MYDAFISYSRCDLRAVQGLKRQLDEQSLTVFLDLDSLRAGEDWLPQFGRALQNSRMTALCWSTQAAASEWVRAEINHCLSTPVPVLPWLLDSTPLPSMLVQTQGIPGTDAAPVVKAVAAARNKWNRRRFPSFLATIGVPVAILWLLLSNPQRMTFRGHVVDELGNAVSGGTVEAEGVRAETRAGGEFALVLSGPATRR